jgi:hypothetical protein
VVQLRVRWWLKWYIRAVVLFAGMTGLEPNWDRVEFWLRRALHWRRMSPRGGRA